MELHAALVPVLEILRAEGVIVHAPAPTGPIADELSRYDAHMSSARGLAAGTRRDRLRIVERLLLSKFAGQPVAVSSLLPEDVRQFIVDQLQALGTTSNAITIASTLRAYLRYRASFELDNMGHRLASFARYVANAGHRGPLTVDLMADWARQAKAGHGDRATLARRLKMLRPFTAWLRQFDPATEVPDEAIFGRVPGRMTPHVYREPEIVELLAAARQLGPEGGLRPAMMETLFGLVACTGLRISEALGLLDADVDLRASVMTIRQSKFGKTRLVPLHPSAVQALEHYRDHRARHVRTTPELPFFVASRGQLLGHPVGDRQVHRVFGDLRRQLGWVDRGSHGTPRIHDLRHYSESRNMPSSVSKASNPGGLASPQ